MTPAGIEPATFQFVAQHLNHCATAVPRHTLYTFLDMTALCLNMVTLFVIYFVSVFVVFFQFVSFVVVDQ